MTTTINTNFSPATASMSIASRIVAVAALGFVLFFPTHTFAQKTDADIEAKAKAAFIEGFDLFNKGEYQKAADKFREALHMNPSWKLYYNIGQAEAASKRYGVALAAFESYLASGGDEIDNSRQIEVQEEIYRLRNMVGFVEVKTSRGAKIRIDGLFRGVYPVVRRIPISAAVVHEIEIEDKEGNIQKESIRVYGGDTVQLNDSKESEDTTEVDATAPVPQEVDAKPLDEPDASGKPEAVKPAPINNNLRTMRISGWVGVATGGALMLAGSITGSLAMAKEKTLEDKCTDSGCYSSEYDILDSRDKLARASTVLLVSGAVVAAAGTAMLIAVKKKKETARVTMLPTLTGVFVSGRF